MTKKLLSLLLTLALLLSVLPVSALAWEEDIGLNRVSVLAWQDGYRGVNAYQKGDDLLISAEDLAWLSDCEVTVEANCCKFTRGSKTVRVDLESHVISLAGVNYGIYAESPCRQIDGVWYLSAASVLPWLNVHCSVEEGVLYATPNAISLWDVIADFDLTDYSFDLKECCSTIGINSSLLEAGAFLHNNGFGSMWYLVPNCQGSNMGTELAFYDLFSDMIRDVTASDQSVPLWLERYEEAGDLIENFGVLIGLGLADDELAEVFDTKVITYTKSAMEVLAYCALFDQDGENKVAMLRTLVSGSDADSNSAMVDAALDVIEDYSDFWEGVFNKVTHATVNALTGELTSGTVFGFLGYVANLVVGYEEAVDRISLYETLMGEALNGYKAGVGRKSLAELEDYVNSIMLYLYASEQNYRAMAAYMEAENRGPMSAYYDFLDRADAAEAAQAQFLNISLMLEDDCADFDLKRTAAEEYLELFDELDYDLVPQGVTAAAERAIFLAAVQEMGLSNLAWTLADSDNDGEDELFLYTTETYEGAWDWHDYLMLDTNALRLSTYCASIVSEWNELLATQDGQRYYIRCVVDADVYQEIYYVGENGRWSVACQCWQMWEFTGNGETGYELTQEDYILPDGTQRTQEAYQAAVEALKLSAQAVTLDSPDLTNQTISGDTEELMEQLDDYFDWRPAAQYSYDLNGDGVKDRVYLRRGAYDFWQEQAYVAGQFGGERYLCFEDEAMTAVVAESRSDGVRLRVCRLNVSGLSDKDFEYGMQWDRDAGTLTLGSYVFSYQSDGAPFAASRIAVGDCVTGLLGLSQTEAAAQVEDFCDWGGGYCEGKFGSGMLTLTFSEAYGVPANQSTLADLTLAVLDDTPVGIAEGVNTAMTVGEIIANMPNCTDWTQLEAVSYNGEIYCYQACCTYTHTDGSRYGLTLTCDSDTTDAALTSITFCQIQI